MKINGNAIRILRYIYAHNGQTLLVADIAKDCIICRDTVSDWVKRLAAGGLIVRDGKSYFITSEGVTRLEDI